MIENAMFEYCNFLKFIFLGGMKSKSGETEGEGIFRFAAFCEVCKLLVIA